MTDFRGTPHPVIVTIMDNRDYGRVLLYSYYTTITGWGVLLRQTRRYGWPEARLPKARSGGFSNSGVPFWGSP